MNSQLLSTVAELVAGHVQKVSGFAFVAVGEFEGFFKIFFAWFLGRFFVITGLYLKERKLLDNSYLVLNKNG